MRCGDSIECFKHPKPFINRVNFDFRISILSFGIIVLWLELYVSANISPNREGKLSDIKNLKQM